MLYMYVLATHKISSFSLKHEACINVILQNLHKGEQFDLCFCPDNKRLPSSNTRIYW